MNFFKKKKHEQGKIVDDTENAVTDFQLRANFWSYRPIDYHEHLPFIHYMVVIDKYLEELFMGDVDSGNKDVLDDLISDITNQAIQDLKKQKPEHIDKINELYHRRCGDVDHYKNLLAEVWRLLKRNEKEYQELSQRYWENKFIKGGSDNDE